MGQDDRYSHILKTGDTEIAKIKAMTLAEPCLICGMELSDNEPNIEARIEKAGEVLSYGHVHDGCVPAKFKEKPQSR